ncbi:hypothetical protein [Amycolatopsis sp.]|uniref:hypothetical protein n=1 Tax=Amycolatopsis sp. TaxID=37632 RepID=UPI002C688BC6|nr:hypothetical protein [Amycolatopsis sp.]HVV11882.1 hypothetical protein [Amycolatopsis sp.]
MIGPADDLMIHQTHEPVRYASTSDRRFYDRHFLTGHSQDGDVFFLLGMGVYPNLGVIDAFASVAVGDTQTTTRASRELGVDRLDSTGVGPVDLQVLEGLRRLRFFVAPGDHAVSLDLLWEGSVPAFEEPPLHSRVAGRLIEQGTRLIQTGRWSGHVTVAGRRFEVGPDTWWGARDRSWGVRSIGLEREPKGIAQAHGLGKKRPPLWIWSPMQFEKRTVHLVISEHASGEREIETVRHVPVLPAGGEFRELSEPAHELKFDSDRELLEGSSVSFRDIDGSRRTVTLEPLRRAYLRAGTGYGGPDPWRHGAYMGESWVDSVSFDLSDEALTKRIGPTHVLCRMTTDTGEVGYGTFETQVFGAFPPYGFDS